MGGEQHQKYEFDGFRLEPGRRRLLSPDGEAVNLSSRVFDTLLYMVEHPGALLDKNTLMQAVWPDTVVEENNLNQAVAALRKALGETPGDQRFVLTEPGRGYRFVAEVKVIRPEAENDPRGRASLTFLRTAHAIPRWFGIGLLVLILAGVSLYLSMRSTPTEQAPEVERAVMVAPPPESVAVLPFVDLSPEGDQAYFADGVAEEVLNRLSGIRDLRVAGHTSSFSFKGKDENLQEIARQLNVAYILEGSVRKDGNRVRISAQLVKAEDGFNIWTESYDRELEDLFLIQEETARAVAGALSVSLGVGAAGSAAGGTRNFAAYDAYLAGNAFYYQSGRTGITQAIEHYERAVALDPEFAQAWSALSVAAFYAATVFVTERAGELWSRSKAAASRAVVIAPRAVPSLRAQALLQVQNREWAAAERSFESALELAPADYTSNRDYGLFLLDVGRSREASRYLERAAKIEPLALQSSYMLGLAYFFSGQLQEAAREYRRGEGLGGDRMVLNVYQLMLGMETGDRPLMDASLDALNDNPMIPAKVRTLSREMHAALDAPEAARGLLNRLFSEPENHEFAMLNAVSVWASYVGEHELALAAYRELSGQEVIITRMIWGPVHSEMRRLAGFKDIVQDLGLVEYWRATDHWAESCHPEVPDDFECE